MPFSRLDRLANLYICPATDVPFFIIAARQVIYTDILAFARRVDESVVSCIYAHVRYFVFAGCGKKNKITFQQILPIDGGSCVVLLSG